MFECPQHHQSQTPDYCSVCGIEILPAGSQGCAQEPAIVPSTPARAVSEAAEACPECGAARESGTQVFCEVCGYNFRTRQAGAPPAVLGPESSAPVLHPPVAQSATSGQVTAGESPRAVPVALPAGSITRWDVVVQVDPMLYGTVNSAAPTGQPQQTFSLFEAENVLGRATAGVRVRIPIAHDSGVSRRHALFLLRPDQGLSVRDLGSANGTQLNGAELLPGVATPLKDGDVLAVGAWTRITIRGVHA